MEKTVIQYDGEGYSYRLEIEQGWMWTQHHGGDAYTYVTCATLFRNGNFKSRGRSRKHFLDINNPVVGRTVAIADAFNGDYHVPRYVRKYFWNMIGEKKR